jgi:hypothetical protein
MYTVTTFFNKILVAFNEMLARTSGVLLAADGVTSMTTKVSETVFVIPSYNSDGAAPSLL